MKQKNMLKRRRAFLKTGLFITGAAVIGTGLNFTVRPETQSIARILTHYLDYPDLAIQLGKSIVKNEPALAKLTIEQLTDLVLQDAGLKKEQLTYYSLLTNKDSYRKTVHKDFDMENIVHVDGWVISRTEAHLCALLYLYDNAYGKNA
ncbi:MAG: hypothetical protein BMS9Abin25_0854 [Gammaproteobacteria bacterium]|nr:MAG: hypothetical protein BMS9Abin25_0854 [Gammaproteobacteria bacterium]